MTTESLFPSPGVSARVVSSFSLSPWNRSRFLPLSLSLERSFKTWLESLGSKVFGSAFNDAIDPWSTDGESVLIDPNLCSLSWKILSSREISLIFLDFFYFLRFKFVKKFDQVDLFVSSFIFLIISFYFSLTRINLSS